MEVESLIKALELIKKCCSENKYCKTCTLCSSDGCVVISSGTPDRWVIEEQNEKIEL